VVAVACVCLVFRFRRVSHPCVVFVLPSPSPPEASSARVAQYQRSLDEYNAAYHEALAKAGAAVHNTVAESEDEDSHSDDDDEDDTFPSQPMSFDDPDADDAYGGGGGGGGGSAGAGGRRGSGAGAGAGAGAGLSVAPSTPPHGADRGGGGAEPVVPLTPQGRLDDRIRLLRDRLSRELGRATFGRVYTYLKVSEWGRALSGRSAAWCPACGLLWALVGSCRLLRHACAFAAAHCACVLCVCVCVWLWWRWFGLALFGLALFGLAVVQEQRWGADGGGDLDGGGLEVGGEAFGDEGGLDSEAVMHRELARMLGGRDVTKYQRVVEHLLFMENSVGAL